MDSLTLTETKKRNGGHKIMAKDKQLTYTKILFECKDAKLFIMPNGREIWIPKDDIKADVGVNGGLVTLPQKYIDGHKLEE